MLFHFELFVFECKMFLCMRCSHPQVIDWVVEKSSKRWLHFKLETLKVNLQKNKQHDATKWMDGTSHSAKYRTVPDRSHVHIYFYIYFLCLWYYNVLKIFYLVLYGVFTRKEISWMLNWLSDSDKQQPNMAPRFLRNAVLHHENQSEGVSLQIVFQ